MTKFLDFINSHLDFKLYKPLIFPILAALAIIPCVKYLPEHYGYENGVIENIQMAVLAVGFLLAVFSKVNKKFFYFGALVIILLVAREINYGRTIFFPIPGVENAYYPWSEIKYGWLVNPLIWVYIAGGLLYFILSKAYIELFNIIKKVKFPVWNLIFLFMGVILGEYAEKATNNYVFEEISELLFYVSLVVLIWLYGYNKNFRSE